MTRAIAMLLLVNVIPIPLREKKSRKAKKSLFSSALPVLAIIGVITI